MSGAPQVAMRITSQIWQIFFASQTLQIFCLALRKKGTICSSGIICLKSCVILQMLLLSTF
jgi:type IV secretory pathway TrbL component